MLRTFLNSPSVRAACSLVQQPKRFLSQDRLLKLNDLSHIEGSIKTKRRWGRGVGSGRGKLCGYGHQKSRSTPRGFEGGQTPLYKRLPKIGFHNPSTKEFREVNLQTVQEFIDKGKLVPQPNKLLTMRDLVLAGILTDVGDGVSLLANGKDTLKTPVHFEVSRASANAIKAVEAAGGTVTCVHFNELALRALIKPYKFDILPNRARPAPKLMQYYLDYSKAGYLSPEIQARNLKLFGSVTSEPFLREEHENFMAYRRQQWAVERQEKIEALKKTQKN